MLIHKIITVVKVVASATAASKHTATITNPAMVGHTNAAYSLHGSTMPQVAATFASPTFSHAAIKSGIAGSPATASAIPTFDVASALGVFATVESALISNPPNLIDTTALRSAAAALQSIATPLAANGDSLEAAVEEKKKAIESLEKKVQSIEEEMQNLETSIYWFEWLFTPLRWLLDI